MRLDTERIEESASSWKAVPNIMEMGKFSIAAEYSGNGVDMLDIESCEALDEIYLPDHALSMIKLPSLCQACWEGHRFRKSFQHGDALFIPSQSNLGHAADRPYNKTVIYLKHRIFEAAAREHVDFSQIDFSFQDVTSQATWSLGVSLEALVRDAECRCWPLLIESASTALVLAIIKQLSPRASTAFRPVQYGLSSVKRRRVLSYIEDNLHRQITLVELADVASLSHYHFCRKFKNQLGMTPLQYLAKRRVDEAQRMLRSTDDSLVVISMACGFASQSHFNTVFRRVTGTTPGAYRSGAG